jgi:hypothetical protein
MQKYKNLIILTCIYLFFNLIIIANDILFTVSEYGNVDTKIIILISFIAFIIIGIIRTIVDKILMDYKIYKMIVNMVVLMICILVFIEFRKHMNISSKFYLYPCILSFFYGVFITKEIFVIKNLIKSRCIK